MIGKRPAPREHISVKFLGADENIHHRQGLPDLPGIVVGVQADLGAGGPGDPGSAAVGFVHPAQMQVLRPGDVLGKAVHVCRV